MECRHYWDIILFFLMTLEESKHFLSLFLSVKNYVSFKLLLVKLIGFSLPLSIFFFFELEIEIYTTHTQYLGRTEGFEPLSNGGKDSPCTTRPSA